MKKVREHTGKRGIQRFMVTDEIFKIHGWKRCKYSIIVEAAIYGWRQQTNMIHDRNVKGTPKKKEDIMEEKKQLKWRGCKFEIRALLVVLIIHRD